VVERVTNGKGVMPSFSDSLSKKEIADVAAYVSGSR
jgi:mono/diheme cytochrome c family protein